jgi:hypothetical protein
MGDFEQIFCCVLCDDSKAIVKDRLGPILSQSSGCVLNADGTCGAILQYLQVSRGIRKGMFSCGNECLCWAQLAEEAPCSVCKEYISMRNGCGRWHYVKDHVPVSDADVNGLILHTANAS